LGQGRPGGVEDTVQPDGRRGSGAHKDLLTMRHAAAAFAAGRDQGVIYCVSCQS
jgi:hypothetical protein